MHEGSEALSRVECRGVRVDVKYLNSAIKKIGDTIIEAEQELTSFKEYKQWRKRYGTNMKLSSRAQLSTVLFDVMGYEAPEKRTEGGKIKADKTNLEPLDIPFVKNYLRIERLKKARGVCWC